MKFKYLKMSKSKKLRYFDNYYEKNLYIIFLHGLMSNIEGKKPLAFKKYSMRKKLGFFALEYSGHGKSSGKFNKGNISIWTKDTKTAIEKIVKKNDMILIGSSMGAWISLNMFKYFKNQIRGFIGIGSAPEFTNRLMWKKFDKKIKHEIIKKGLCNVKYGDYEYSISNQLIQDGKKNKVLSKKIKSSIQLTMIHGQKDEVVPIGFSKKVLNIFVGSKKKLLIIKNGDHSLSDKKSLKKIIKELNRIVINII